ncbi:MAG: ADP-ribosylglycohydrolase family protein [Candidatus Riflebacteria bacterium]|nr:ADP-ribosylglycohydrolase family protein [Candidatus Riflebacteria bacterium]
MTDTAISNSFLDKIRGIILGTTLGDSLGLPFEGMLPTRIEKLFAKPLRHQFLFGKGMTSDDTDHTYFIAQSLIGESENPEKFAVVFSRYLRLWILTLPAGVGWATLRSGILLLLGFSPYRSGVFSAGNGPAMRSALIGAFFYNSPQKRDEFVKASTTISHTDPKAFIGAKAVADLTAFLFQKNPGNLPKVEEINKILIEVAPENPEWQQIIQKLFDGLKNSLSPTQFAGEIAGKKGISGYVYQTVPIAIFCAIHSEFNLPKTIESLILCGGDTDTTCAIAGAMIGAFVGEEKLPKELIDKIIEWPRTVRVLQKTGNNLFEKMKNPKIPWNNNNSYFWPALPIRNLFFLAIVFLHIFRRLFPPY